MWIKSTPLSGYIFAAQRLGSEFGARVYLFLGSRAFLLKGRVAARRASACIGFDNRIFSYEVQLPLSTLLRYAMAHALVDEQGLAQTMTPPSVVSFVMSAFKPE
ncbi:uncharacterized protein PHALS_10822 [Plasmopara halstedii]|uniref:Uncharacterized protein n=1 Tax=Plasmopara halstedii TaxID=4781 RepID=A0A0P1AIQ6_PLAHL|nr:uncharacterized protein PHALS_10822 [Plasmopara halstedii]CEG40636.1 hypothetical protein PHALS_10822 [Plasmopara halstedii]|eukprot:XP_024577005.1 hypothetical protein PHALS_10822 [Plasmopara halstedii]